MSLKLPNEELEVPTASETIFGSIFGGERGSRTTGAPGATEHLAEPPRHVFVAEGIDLKYRLCDPMKIRHVSKRNFVPQDGHLSTPKKFLGIRVERNHKHIDAIRTRSINISMQK